MFSGLSFIHAGFLAAGLAVALPLFIHLLFRQRTRTVSIGSVRFLQQVARDHRRRRRLRQWILLALRCLAALLLALLFARPFLDRSGLASLQQEVVLLLDRSASMASHDGQGKSAFSRAIEAGRSFLQPLDENVVVHVGLCDATGAEEIPASQLTADLVPSAAATDYGAAIGWARDLLSASRRKDRRVVLISDLQQSGLGQTAVEQLPADVHFELIDVGQPVSDNVSLIRVQMLRTEIRPQNPVTLRAVVQNHSPAALRKVPLEIRLQGPEKSEVRVQRSVDLSGGGTAVVDVPLDVTLPGLYQGQGQLTVQDGSPWDNLRYVAFEARHPDRVLLVDGDEGRSVFANETYYLETALRLPPAEGAARQRSFEVERLVWEAGEGFPDLTGFRAILLANVRRLSEADVQRLAEYVRGGGGLMIFAGEQSNPLHFDALEAAGVFPGKVKREPLTAPLRITSWDAKHPALAPFTDPQRGDLRRINFRRVLPLSELSTDSQRLLQAGPQLLAAERRLGNGHCIYFGSTADRDWNDWPQSRLYVPLIRQATGYLTGQIAEEPPVANEWVTRRGETPGFAENASQLVVRNIDPRESLPERLTAEELRLALGVEEEHLAPEEQAKRAAVPLPPDALRPEERWTWVAWILLAILAIETLLASRVHA